MTCQVVRVGIFFDGTGNNLFNDEAGRSSNGVSNIGKLFRLYRDGEVIEGRKTTECEIVIHAIYVEGVGTNQGEDDYTSGLASGALGGRRIRLAIEQLTDILDEYPPNEYRREIDIFGFSRGAAMARDFINSLYGRIRLSKTLKIKFVGLFDTVGSFGLPGNDIDWKPITDEDTETDAIKYEMAGKTPPAEYYEPYNFNLSPQSAETIVHFIALDEYRKNFPLSDTQDAGFTYGFIGAHSDVGGGYRKKEKENVIVLQDTRLTVLAYQKQLNTQSYDAEIEGEWRCYSGGIDRATMESIPARCKAIRNVSDDLQNVALAAMHHLAVRPDIDVPFKPIEEVYPDLIAPENWTIEMQAYYERAVHNLSELKDYLAQGEMVSNGETGEFQEVRSRVHMKILGRYGHNSSAISSTEVNIPTPLGLMHRLANSITESLSNSPRRAGRNFVYKRAVFRNNTSKAVTKV